MMLLLGALGVGPAEIVLLLVMGGVIYLAVRAMGSPIRTRRTWIRTLMRVFYRLKWRFDRR